jgi:hypothetical protein
MDHIAVKKLSGNQCYLLAAIFAHNLNRELQMATNDRDRGTNKKRTSLWTFHELKWIRHRFLQRTGRLTTPQGNLKLTMSGNDTVKQGLFQFLDALKIAA